VPCKSKNLEKKKIKKNVKNVLNKNNESIYIEKKWKKKNGCIKYILGNNFMQIICQDKANCHVILLKNVEVNPWKKSFIKISSCKKRKNPFLKKNEINT